VAWIERDESELRQVQKELLGLLFDQHNALVERGARINAQLSQQIAGGGGLQGVSDFLAAITSRGVIIQDKRLAILAYHATSDFSEAWEGVLQLAISPELIPDAYRDRKRVNAHTGLLITEFPGGLERMIAPIMVNDVARGYISLIGLAGQMDALDQVALEQGAQLSAVEMARIKAVRETEKRLRGDLLSALLEENLSPRDARLWVQALGMDPDQPSVALRFIWDAPNPPSRRRLETLINGEISRLAAPVLASPLGVEVICFYILPNDAPRPEAALSLAEAILSQAQREFPEIPLYCGVGTPAIELNAWRTSFRQAGQAMELSRRLGVRKPVYFSDLSVFRLLMQIEHSPELVAFQEEILGSLLAHEGSEEFLRTLSAFFEHNANLSHTSEALFIHRNTLLYRMERIASITGLDLEQPETRLAVQLALHIYRMRGGSV
jgi:purine catabolism regulator